MATPFPQSQLATLNTVQAILCSAGLAPHHLNSADCAVPSSCTLTPVSHCFTPSSTLSLPPSPEVIVSQYELLPAQFFSINEIDQGLNKINCETTVDRVIWHPHGAIVEYLQTGAADGATIAHIFDVDPHPKHFIHPKASFQYSLGDGHSSHDNMTCFLFKSQSGAVVLCVKLHTLCQ
ncbi:hypothetical protein PAXRUDRAFT_155811 [Paxillus rubicundulus Ve08.2h10]|uniref:Uncharacterized protein n=1 Tax=Paxillus rubicundulus Ve08.2h10 TaxID=930991 RepID=A0A0D0DBU0_9AGAM|nr:hypothetical protein PAXRUDRAFT_155811 [Paxillus rubicundulus Ve08.2h10]